MTDKWTPKQVNPNDTQRQMTWDEIANALAASERQRKELEAQAAVLAAALQALCDEQNGPPLIKYEKTWEAAYRQAEQVLANLPQAVQRHLERNKAVGGEVRE